MASINQATILGNVGKEPEIRRTSGGQAIASFSVATSETWKDKNSGEKKESTEWHKIVVFGRGDNDGLVGIVQKYVKKGSKVYIQGAIKTRKWQDQAGADRYSTEIVLSGFDGKLVLLDSRDGSRAGPSSSDDYRRASGGRDAKPASTASSKPKSTFHNEIDDEIPFLFQPMNLGRGVE
jgi:single-strand DNA-binding protein